MHLDLSQRVRVIGREVSRQLSEMGQGLLIVLFRLAEPSVYSPPPSQLAESPGQVGFVVGSFGILIDQLLIKIPSMNPGFGDLARPGSPAQDRAQVPIVPSQLLPPGSLRGMGGELFFALNQE